MATPPLNDGLIEERMAVYLELVDQGMLPFRTTFPRTTPSATVEAAKRLGLDVKTMTRTIELAARRGYGLHSRSGLLPGFAVKEVSNVTDRDGNLIRQAVKTAPERTETFEPLPGHVIKGESVLTDADGLVVQRWVKTREGAQDHLDLIEALKKALGELPARDIVEPPLTSISDCLTVYPIADLHLGMMAWGKESGADYDLDIAARNAIDAAQYLVAQSRPTREAVILGLGDYFHQNDQRNSTPRSGHQLDVDGRWPKVLLTGVRVADAIIRAALAKHETVKVRMLPGNHDPDAAIALSVALAMAYRDNDRVTVDLDPSLHWYMRFGRVLLGATHGHTIRSSDRMAMMMATDRAEDWGETIHRHFFFGHIHHDTVKDVGPVRVESFRTIAAKDAYTAGGGYRSPRTLTAITFHADRGEIGRHKINL
jgi:hypothetical protein